jgi:hypothetical protein
MENRKSSRGRAPRKQKRAATRPKGPIRPEEVAALATLVRRQGQQLATMSKPTLVRRGGFGMIGDGADRAYEGIKRLLNIELKSMETGGFVVSPAQTGTSVDFTALITQGDGDQNRDGDSIKLVRLLLDLSAQPNSGGLVSQFVRVMVVRSHDEAVTPSQVINVDATAYTHVGLRNWDYKGQYTCLWDHCFVMDAYHPTHRKQLSFELNSHVQFNAGTATVNNGAIQLLYWSTATSLLPSLTYQAALEFVDN